VFGCLCYPWLRPYTSHKLKPHSKPCIFFGYSLTQSAYLYYDPSTSKVFISRNVKFVESIYPFKSIFSQDTCPNSSTFTTWIPPPNPLSIVTPTLISPSTVWPYQHLHNEGLSVPTPASETSLLTTSNTHTQTPSLHLTDKLHPAIQPNHHMQTRAKSNIHKPLQKLDLHTTLSQHSDLEPTTSAQARKDPKWHQAMSDEFNALIRNGTWQLIPASSNQNVVGCKWIFRTKRHSNGSIDKYKACLVAKGFHQRPDVDYYDTFSPVIKPTIIRLVLNITISSEWTLRQFDVNNTFLQGTLTEQVYMYQPPGFIDKDFPSHVCKLQKAIYGLKEAPRAWFHELKTFLLQSGFQNSHADTSLFVLHLGKHIVYLLVYVDDLIIIGDDVHLVNRFINLLAHRFSLKDLGQLSYFFGIEILPTK